MNKKLRKTAYTLLIRSHWIWPKYRLPGCTTYNHRHLVELKLPNQIKGSLIEYLHKLEQRIQSALSESNPISIIRVSDGEGYFLKGQTFGNIGKRHLLSQNLSKLDYSIWKERLKENDEICFDIVWSLRRIYKDFFRETKNNIRWEYCPFDIIYAEIASRRFFELTKNYRVGLIGAGTKLDLIKELMKYSEYRKYIGIEDFAQYIHVPQRGACDEAEKVFKSIVDQIGNNRCDIYLVGMGIVKLYIQSQLKKELQTSFLDIGCGVDAIAGIVPNDKPFFGDWINYRIEGYDYKDIDFLSKKNPYIEDKVVYLPKRT